MIKILFGVHYIKYINCIISFRYVVQNSIVPLSISRLGTLINNILNSSLVKKYDEERTPVVEYNPNLKHILVVDDDVKMLRLISGYLSDSYKVSVVNSGAAAIAFLGKKRPDLILLDYLMPICDGAQVLEMIRDLKGMEDIPVIFLTGVSDKDSVKQCLKLNPQWYLLKPVAIDVLIKRLNKIFGVKSE